MCLPYNLGHIAQALVLIRLFHMLLFLFFATALWIKAINDGDSQVVNLSIIGIYICGQ